MKNFKFLGNNGKCSGSDSEEQERNLHQLRPCDIRGRVKKTADEFLV